MKKAFTIIELIFTIVILSIVAYVSTGLIAKTYVASRYTTSLNKINLKIEIALTEIANRLEYAINNTVVKRKGNQYEAIALAPSDYEVLEWVGYDIDSFDANEDNNTNKYKPSWSGFCDLKQSSGNGATETIITPGSNLDFAKSIVYEVSSRKISNLANVGVFFPGNFDYDNIGYGGSSVNGVATITDVLNNTTIKINNPSKRITEKYKLAWSAYAIVPTNCGSNGCNLELRYNFKPWKGKDYNSNSGVKKSLLVKGVTVFKTYATQNRIHIKLCVKDHYSMKKTTSICKEKVIFK